MLLSPPIKKMDDFGLHPQICWNNQCTPPQPHLAHLPPLRMFLAPSLSIVIVLFCFSWAKFADQKGRQLGLTCVHGSAAHTMGRCLYEHKKRPMSEGPAYVRLQNMLLL